MNKAITPKNPKKSYELPLYITKTMRLLETIHPKLATTFALKLFFTPLRFPIPEREMPLRKEAKIHHLNTGKSDFKVLEWGRGRKQIVLMHGWSGRASQFFKIIEALLAEKYHVYSIEAPSHGDSKQQKTNMLEFVEALDTTVKKFGNFDYAIGHSLGGMVIFNALKGQNFNPKKIIAIGTPANIRKIVYDFCHKVGAGKKVAQSIISHIENEYSMKIENSSTDHLAQEFNPKGMIIHDVDDLDVDISNAKALKEKWPNANLMVTNGLRHRKVLMDRKVVDSIIGFLPLD